MWQAHQKLLSTPDGLYGEMVDDIKIKESPETVSILFLVDKGIQPSMSTTEVKQSYITISITHLINESFLSSGVPLLTDINSGCGDTVKDMRNLPRMTCV